MTKRSLIALIAIIAPTAVACATEIDDQEEPTTVAEAALGYDADVAVDFAGDSNVMADSFSAANASFAATSAYDPFAPDAMRLEATGTVDGCETELVLVTGRPPKANDAFEVQQSYEDCKQYAEGSRVCIGEQTSVPASDTSAIVIYRETCGDEKRQWRASSGWVKVTADGNGNLALGLEEVPFDHDFQGSEWVAVDGGHELMTDNASEGRILVDGTIALTPAE